MKHTIVVSFATWLLLVARLAAADPHHVLVLRAEGNADPAVRAKVAAAVVKLAKLGAPDANVEAGEVSFSDAAAAVGCTGNEAQCRDEVLSTLAIDEAISISVSTSPTGDLKILVHRIPKGAPIRDAQTTVPAGSPDPRLAAKIEADVGPIFGVNTAAAPAATTGGISGGPTGPNGPTPSTTTSPGTGAVLPAFGDATHPVTTAQNDPNAPTVTAAPSGQVTAPEGRSNRPVIGLGIGGGMVLLALIMWGEASSTQGDINAAPTRSPADFQNLQNLESKGDAYATLGNLFFIGGLAVTGVSGYYFWKSRRASTTTSSTSAQARLVPTLFDHGAGIALTIGGAP